VAEDGEGEEASAGEEAREVLGEAGDWELADVTDEGDAVLTTVTVLVQPDITPRTMTTIPATTSVVTLRVRRIFPHPNVSVQTTGSSHAG
jgi:hypothetical protein